MNFTPLNNTALNYGAKPSDLFSDDITFNSYGLQNASVVSGPDGIGIRDFPDRDFASLDISQWDGEIFNSIFFRGRDITINWHLIAPNKAELDDLIDEMKKRVSKKEKLLKWKVNDITRQITASVSSLTFGTKENIYISYSISFKTADSFWELSQKQSFLIEDISGSPHVESILNEWEATNPMFVFGFKTGLVGVTSINISVSGIGIDIAQAISDGDILIIDGITKSVYYNGVEIDFDGVFPLFETDDNLVTFTINGTYTADISVIYSNKIL